MQVVPLLSKGLLTAGSALVLFSVAGAAVKTYPTYALYYFAAATGLTLVIAGLIALA
jgi:hypothetical protein